MVCFERRRSSPLSQAQGRKISSCTAIMGQMMVEHRGESGHASTDDSDVNLRKTSQVRLLLEHPRGLMLTLEGQWELNSYFSN